MNPTAQLLIVDDEAPQMRALCDTLKHRDYATTGFTSAREALAALRTQKFDLLLTDLSMPEMDGVTLLRAALDVDPNLVGIMMTGHGTIGAAVEAMKAGALDFILKPFKLGDIVPVLTRALTVRRLRLENAELAGRVRDRTAELEAANRELEAFSYSVSHDLRAPLRGMEDVTRILLDDGGSRLSERERTFIRAISSSAAQMGTLIEGLLNLSRMGRQQLVKQPVSVTDLVNQVLHELAKEREGRRVDVQVAALPDCVGDPSLLKQVYINLLANAFKFTRAKEQATIEVGYQDRDGEHVYFVRDNGAGFDMQYAGKLFREFQRLHSKEQFEGTGVGLSIVQRVIQRHGGRVWAESEVDKGASFYFTLPLPEQAAGSN